MLGRLRQRSFALVLLAPLVLLMIAAPVVAQDKLVQLFPVLTIDQDRLFAESLFGKAVNAAFRAQSEAHIAENRKIEAQLSAEELDLTNERPTLLPADFAKMAKDFDTKVSGIRSAQDNKSRNLTKQLDEDRARFFEAARPVLAQLMAERGAVAIIDKRAVFLGFDAIDLTDAAIARLDEVLGDGGMSATSGRSAPEDVTQPAPDPATDPVIVPDQGAATQP